MASFNPLYIGSMWNMAQDIRRYINSVFQSPLYRVNVKWEKTKKKRPNTFVSIPFISGQCEMWKESWPVCWSHVSIPFISGQCEISAQEEQHFSKSVSIPFISGQCEIHEFTQTRESNFVSIPFISGQCEIN